MVDLARAKELSREIWDRRAEEWDKDYERIWKSSKHVSEWMIDHLEVQAGDTVLELAAGPAETAFLVHERIGPSGKLIVTDFSAGMIQAAKRRAAQHGLNNVEFKIVDAEKMDLPDDSVDGVLCRWGFMLMTDPDAAFNECARVLRSGRRLSFATWGPPYSNPWITVFGMVLVPRGHMEATNPFGPGGMFSLSEQSVISTRLQAAGFSNVVVEELPVTFADASFEEYFDRQKKTAGPVADILQNLDTDELDEVREEVKKLLESHIQADGSLAIPGLAVVAAAKRA